MDGVVIVSGERCNGKIYINDHHIYKTSRTLGNVVHLRCYFVACQGTAVFFDGDEFVRVVQGHNHTPDLEEEDRLLFRQAVRDDAAQTTLKAASIIEYQSAKHPAGSSGFTAADCRALIRRAREKMPPVPLSLGEAANTMSEPEWRGWSLQRGTRNSKLFRKRFESAGLSGLLLVCTGENAVPEGEALTLVLRRVMQLPRHPPTLKVVLQVSLVREKEQQHFLLPWAYILFEDDLSMNLVMGLREFQRECCDGKDISHIISDGRNPLHVAISTVWPVATLSTSLFLSSVLELDHLFDASGGHLISDTESRAFRTVMAIIALPAQYVKEAQVVLQQMFGGPFIQQLVERWDTVACERVSAEATPRALEPCILQSMLALGKDATTGHPKPSMWQFIEALRCNDEYLVGKFTNAAPARSRPNLRRDPMTAFLVNLLQKLPNNISLQAYLERAEIVMKCALKTLTCLAKLQTPIFRDVNGNEQEPVQVVWAQQQAPRAQIAASPSRAAGNTPANLGLLCLICHDNQAEFMLEPCHHFGICTACRQKRVELNSTPQVPDPIDGYVLDHSSCPVCKVQVCDHVRVFVQSP